MLVVYDAIFHLSSSIRYPAAFLTCFEFEANLSKNKNHHMLQKTLALESLIGQKLLGEFYFKRNYITFLQTDNRNVVVHTLEIRLG